MPAQRGGPRYCVSFTVMRDRGITDALAGDRHFTEAGFDARLLHR